MEFWNRFAAKHSETAKWVREGGLFVIVSNLITVFKYLLLQFLPKAFASLPVVDFGWPGIPVTLFGETFQWNILGYDAAHGGLPYFCAYMIAMVIGECINFPIQRNSCSEAKEIWESRLLDMWLHSASLPALSTQSTACGSLLQVWLFLISSTTLARPC